MWRMMNRIIINDFVDDWMWGTGSVRVGKWEPCRTSCWLFRIRSHGMLVTNILSICGRCSRVSLTVSSRVVRHNNSNEETAMPQRNRLLHSTNQLFRLLHKGKMPRPWKSSALSQSLLVSVSRISVHAIKSVQDEEKCEQSAYRMRTAIPCERGRGQRRHCGTVVEWPHVWTFRSNGRNFTRDCNICGERGRINLIRGCELYFG